MRQTIHVIVVTSALLCGPAAEARGPTRLAQLAPPAAVASRPLAGPEAWAAMLGNTIKGRTPDGDYIELFEPDGTFVHVDRDGRSMGHWATKDQSVCFTYQDEDETECRVPRLEGAQGAFDDTDGTSYKFTLLPGNPEGL